MTARSIASLTAFVLLCGCASRASRPHAIVEAAPPAPRWAGVARAGEAERLDALPARLLAARAAVPRRFAARLRAAGPIVMQAAGQAMPELSPGSYYCRLVRFGGPSGFRSFTPDFCYLTAEPGGLAFTKQTGTSRVRGYVYPDRERRLVFLGTGANGAYGDDPATDMAGIVERVAPFRWRLLLTGGEGSALELYELVPVPAAVPGAKPATQPS